MASGDAPVLEALAEITAVSLERSELDPGALVLARLAALVAVDAPAASYLAHVGPAGDVGIDVETVQDLLIAVAPIVGTPRVLKAARNITVALGVVIEAALEEIEEEE